MITMTKKKLLNIDVKNKKAITAFSPVEVLQKVHPPCHSLLQSDQCQRLKYKSKKSKDKKPPSM